MQARCSIPLLAQEPSGPAVTCVARGVDDGALALRAPRSPAARPPRGHHDRLAERRMSRIQGDAGGFVRGILTGSGHCLRASSAACQLETDQR